MYLVAMPEHLAKRFKATRSPRRILRTGPLTVAQWVMGVKDSPSLTCHSTLISLEVSRGSLGGCVG